ncbi:glycosyltransferase family 4 protein [Nostoc sp. NIES-2111]
MKRLRRVVLVNDAAVARGGATGLSLSLALWLRERGLEVTFVHALDEGNDGLRQAGVEMVKLPGEHIGGRRSLGTAAAGLYNSAAAAGLQRWIADNDDEGTVYHVHGWSKALSPAIFTAFGTARRRLLVHCHDFFNACPNGAYMDYQAMEACALTPLSMACLVRRCDKRSHVQKLWRVARQALLLRTFGDRTEVPLLLIHRSMSKGLERAGFSPDVLHEVRNPVVPFVDERVRAEDNSTVLFAGRIEREKGAGDLALAARKAGVPLVMVGEGPQRAEIAERFPEVQLTGWLDRDGLREQALKARLLVLPSRYPEPFGLVALEALGSGVPVALSAMAFLAPEVVERGMGLSFRSGDTDALAAVLARVATGTDEVAAMSHAARTKAFELCTTPAGWVDRQIALYDRRLEKAA